MSPTIYHVLTNCVKGWSDLFLTKIDVRKVMEISTRERLFCIFEREYKYCINIKYYNPRGETTLSPTFVGGKVGITVSDVYKEYSWITPRYKTLEEAEKEVTEILRLKKIISVYDQEQNTKLNNYVQNYLKDT